MKSLLRILAVVMLTGVLYSFTGRNMAANNAAVVIKDIGCTLSDPWGGITEGFSDQLVATSSGNVTITCHFSGVNNPTGKSFVTKENVCGGINDRLTISASGEASATCHFRF